MIEWKDIPNYEGFYQASNTGVIKSLRRVIVKSNGAAQTIPEKILKPDFQDGYVFVTLKKIGEEKRESVHRLVLQTFVGECPVGMETCHRNGVRDCNNLGNLYWGTKVSNTKDKELHGTIPKGEKHYRAKLSDVQIRQIRADIEDGIFHKDIAVKFGIDKSYVSRINKGNRRISSL